MGTDGAVQIDVQVLSQPILHGGQIVGQFDSDLGSLADQKRQQGSQKHHYQHQGHRKDRDGRPSATPSFPLQPVHRRNKPHRQEQGDEDHHQKGGQLSHHPHHRSNPQHRQSDPAQPPIEPGRRSVETRRTTGRRHIFECSPSATRSNRSTPTPRSRRPRVQACERQTRPIPSFDRHNQREAGRHPTLPSGHPATRRLSAGALGWPGPLCRRNPVRDPFTSCLRFQTSAGGQTRTGVSTDLSRVHLRTVGSLTAGPVAPFKVPGMSAGPA